MKPTCQCLRTENRLRFFYDQAKQTVTDSEFSWEVAWQNDLEFSAFSESDLLRELAWVVLCSGFRESVVRGRFNYISLCFCDWESAAAIVKNADACHSSAFIAFKNVKKLDAIIESARIIFTCGFASIKARVLSDPLVELQKFPFIGSITAQHLSKNLGASFAKDDRHLTTLTGSAGFMNAQQMCQTLANITGDSVQVIDLILWRYMALGGSKYLPQLA